MIDQATIDRIMDTANIVEVVSEFVTLRKRGVNYTGLCPFHNERTPSFSVSPAKQLCKCFSCGEGGNVVHFLMKHEQIGYVEALKWLAKKYGIEVQERELSHEEKQAASLRESLFIVNEYARDYFQHTLFNHIEGKSIGLAYFRQRGFRDDIIRKFQLGFCTKSRDALAQSALQKGYNRDFLLKTGLCYEKDDHSLVDRFHGRVIFPVHGLSGKVIAFGGRILSSEKKLAKYVNSPESEIYRKSNELYGIYLAKQAIVKQDRCFLVEGYTDVISMHQAGIENVVSSSGTALTSGQIKLIHRFTNHITMLYDGDLAGIKASIRGVDMLLEEGMSVKIVLLPDGEDPDSFAQKHNATGFQAFIAENETDFIRFKTSLLLNDAGKDPMKRADLIKDIVQSISVIPEGIVRSVYIRECSQLMQIDENLLLDEVNKAIRNRKQNGGKKTPGTDSLQPSPVPEPILEELVPVFPPNTPPPAEETVPLETKLIMEGCKEQELLLVRLLIRYGEKVVCEVENPEGGTTAVTVAEFIDQSLQEDNLPFFNPLHRRILTEILAHLSQPGFECERYFIQHMDPVLSTLATELATDRDVLSKIYTKGGQTILSDEERLFELAPRLLIDYKDSILSTELKQLIRSLQVPANYENPEGLKKALLRIKELQQIRDHMEKHLGERVVIRR